MKRTLHIFTRWLRENRRWFLTLLVRVVVPIVVAFIAGGYLGPLFFPGSSPPQSQESEDGNHNPIVTAVVVSTQAVKVNEEAIITVHAFDPDYDYLVYTWSCGEGGNLPQGPTTLSSVNWIAPNHTGNIPVYITITDNRGGVAKATVVIPVVEDST